MKIIHTGDWHIGKIVNQVYMTLDQEYILNWLVEFIKDERPDVLVIAGDVYDRAVPPVEAVELLDRFFSQVVLDLKVPVLVIAGNHDSPDRLGFGSGILEAKGLYIEGRLRKDIRKITLKDEHGPVNFFLVPYSTPAVVRDVFGRDDIHDHNSAMQAIIEAIYEIWDSDERNVLVTHGFVTGSEALELSESEKPLSFTASIGGVDNVDVNLFAEFSYTALGHLHGPQKVGSSRVRYAGSLLKYSFSEVTQKKSFTVVTLEADGTVNLDLKEISPRRDMRRIKGTLKELLNPSVYKESNVEDYLHVTLSDEGGLIEPMSRLRTVYPNVLALDFEIKERIAGEAKTAAGTGYKSKSKLELFRDFYCDITGKEFNSEKAAILAKVIGTVEAEERGL
ncbi:MAG: repair exonuclease [Firmicutes bacterium]|nr:repair exonuclease [Bacillota bacterium]